MVTIDRLPSVSLLASLMIVIAGVAVGGYVAGLLFLEHLADPAKLSLPVSYSLGFLVASMAWILMWGGYEIGSF